MTIISREGTDPKYRWKDFLVVSDERVVIVDMKPAILGGWNIGRVTVQGQSDWPGMTEAQIVAWKLANDDRARMAEIPATFAAKLQTAIDQAGVR